MFETEDHRRTALDEEFLRQFLVHQRRIYAYILTLLPRAADADDLLQDTSMTLWRKRGEFTPGTNFGAWACAVAYNLVRNFRMKQGREKLRFDEALLDRISARATRLGHELDLRREILEVCLGKLAPQDRELLESRYQPGVTTKSLAAAAGRPIEGLYKAMRRIHQVLYSCVERTINRGDMRPQEL